MANPSVNFFARELNNIMAERGYSLWTMCEYAGIHRQQVLRLQKSLIPPGNFSMLNPDDLDQVIATFQFDPSQVVRLHAAIIANSVMQVLVERIYLEQALRVTEQVYKHVLAAMKKGKKPYSNVRIVSETSQEENADEILEAILPLIDQATTALHMSAQVSGEGERAYLWQARVYYEAAQLALDEVGGNVKITDAWKQWREEVQERLAEVIDSLGA